MESNFKSGTGLTKHSYSYDKFFVGVDFTGSDKDQCYRNDASIFFFAANSYISSCLIIEKEIEKRFVEKVNIRQIEHLILPYYFNFRHYLELEMKGLIAAVENDFPQPIHSLEKLSNNLYDALTHIKNCNDADIFSIQESVFEEKKRALLSTYSETQKLIQKYCNEEPAEEYYRFIFELSKRKMVLNNPVLSLDFNDKKELFRKIREGMHSICLQLREMNVYVYCFV